mmetsp:Transcript_106736/g.185539  ORF Transcript_106736/g.185539 Transcript_106736/m.185539 type:complete len:90 (-) Transcript_106736:160-429(-)
MPDITLLPVCCSGCVFGHWPMLLFGCLSGIGVGAYNSRHMRDCFNDTCIVTGQKAKEVSNAASEKVKEKMKRPEPKKTAQPYLEVIKKG